MTMELHTTSGSFIFHGPDQAHLARSAQEQARRLNCRGDRPGPCFSCRQIAAGTYPDLITVRSEGKPSINLEQVKGVIATLGLTPYYAGGRRVVIIDGAHLLTPEAQNALLKVLEEPPPSTIFILATQQPGSLLGTVRSRCAEIYLAPELGAAAPDPAGELLGAPDLSLFDRLLLAKQLADAKTDLAPPATALHHAVAEAVRSGAMDSALGARRLSALELFRRQLDARVSPRVALERLMLEL